MIGGVRSGMVLVECSSGPCPEPEIFSPFGHALCAGGVGPGPGSVPCLAVPVAPSAGWRWGLLVCKPRKCHSPAMTPSPDVSRCSGNATNPPNLFVFRCGQYATRPRLVKETARHATVRCRQLRHYQGHPFTFALRGCKCHQQHRTLHTDATIYLDGVSCRSSTLPRSLSISLLCSTWVLVLPWQGF